MQVIAATSVMTAGGNFSQALDTTAIVVGILTSFGMMLVFVYKNRTLVMGCIAEQERERTERTREIERLRAESTQEIERERTARTTLERDVVEMKLQFARLAGQLGVKP